MTKEEKIKEAYGGCINFYKIQEHYLISVNGWTDKNVLNLPESKGIDFEIRKFTIRPKSLQGIDNN